MPADFHDLGESRQNWTFLLISMSAEQSETSFPDLNCCLAVISQGENIYQETDDLLPICMFLCVCVFCVFLQDTLCSYLLEVPSDL